jgi:hypothetical protein
MSLHRGRFVVVLALSLVVVFSGCHKPGMAGAQSIVLTAPNGNCLQNGAAGLVQIDSTGACFAGASPGTAVAVQLPANCPFASCSFPTATGSLCTGTVNAGTPAGTSWVYTSITIGGNACLVGTNGLIMK